MLVSLIIPVYNVSGYLPRLMETVLSQTHKELEIILIDDGSSDSSGELCDRFALTDSRVKVIHTTNSGVADARNAGLNAATGEYIVFADGDDYLEEDYIEYLLNLCTKNNADISCCAWTTDRNGRLNKCSYRKREPGIYKGNHEAMRALLTTRLFSSSVWGKMFKKKIFDEVRFPEGANYYEDDATMYRLASRADSAAIGGEAKYFYTLRDDSMIHRSFNDNNFKMIKVFEERCAYIETYYPELSVYARSDILMAVNHCIIKMSDEKLFDHPGIKGLKTYYKSYEKDYLKGISYFPAKLFSVIAFISIRFAMRLYRLSGRHTRLN
ncbi:MAG: glycosyltransferase family 2 protein [Clostridiales bacterium]|nr:glycosyltransferase family 2 protein [Clostridiales bacterium]